jgi:hypothetical protein
MGKFNTNPMDFLRAAQCRIFSDKAVRLQECQAENDVFIVGEKH